MDPDVGGKAPEADRGRLDVPPFIATSGASVASAPSQRGKKARLCEPARQQSCEPPGQSSAADRRSLVSINVLPLRDVFLAFVPQPRRLTEQPRSAALPVCPGAHLSISAHQKSFISFAGNSAERKLEFAADSGISNLQQDERFRTSFLLTGFSLEFRFTADVPGITED